MNKADLTEVVAKNLKTSKAKAEAAINAVLSGITKGLKKDKKVQLIGFGTFEVRKRKARTGRNPQTGDKITIVGRRILNYKPSNVLRRLLNGSK